MPMPFLRRAQAQLARAGGTKILSNHCGKIENDGGSSFIRLECRCKHDECYFFGNYISVRKNQSYNKYYFKVLTSHNFEKNENIIAAEAYVSHRLFQ